MCFAAFFFGTGEWEMWGQRLQWVFPILHRRFNLPLLEAPREQVSLGKQFEGFNSCLCLPQEHVTEGLRILFLRGT